MGQITYSWQIRPSLSVTYNENNLQNVVNSVAWTYVGQYTPDGETVPTFTTGIRGDTKLPAPNSNEFIAFQNLTEQVIENWIISTMSNDRIFEMQKNLSASIAVNISPVTGIVTAPWL